MTRAYIPFTTNSSSSGSVVRGFSSLDFRVATDGRSAGHKAFRFCLAEYDYLLHPVFDDAGEGFDIKLLS